MEFLGRIINTVITFVISINALSDIVEFSVYLFADDTKTSKTVGTNEIMNAMQNYSDNLAARSNIWIATSHNLDREFSQRWMMTNILV